MIRRSRVQTPLGAILDEIYFVLTSDLSDNLTEMCQISYFLIVKNPNVKLFVTIMRSYPFQQLRNNTKSIKLQRFVTKRYFKSKFY